MLQKFPFQNTAMAYVRKCLTDGKTLSKFVLEQHNIESGLVYAYLPQTYTAKLPLDLEYGAIPAGSASAASQFTASVVARFLRQAEQAYAIFEHPYAKAGDLFLENKRIRFFLFDDEIYEYCDKTTLDFCLARGQLHLGYPSNSYLVEVGSSDIILNNRQPVNKKTVEQLASFVECIIVGAYDQTAELIWIKPGRELSFFDKVPAH